MSTIAQVRIHAPGKVNLDTIEFPACGPRDAIVEVHACGICGSDLSYIRLGGLAGFDDPRMNRSYRYLVHSFAVYSPEWVFFVGIYG